MDTRVSLYTDAATLERNGRSGKRYRDLRHFSVLKPLSALGGPILWVVPIVIVLLVTGLALPRQAAGQAPTPTPDLPVIIDEIKLGIPAGNGHSPQRLAVDSGRGRLYTLNYGLSQAGQGTTLSVLDLATGQVTALVDLGNSPSSSPVFDRQPIDLQIDPYRPRLYALWGDPYDEPTTASLTVIDAETLKVLQTLSGVAAVAPGPDRLYLASDSRLWAVDPLSLAEVAGQPLAAQSTLGPLRLDPVTNRLYLGRRRPDELAIFTADTLIQASRVPLPGQLLAAAVDPAGSIIYLISADEDRVSLVALDPAGRLIPGRSPLSLSDDTYSSLPLTLAGSTLAVAVRSTGDTTHYLKTFSLPGLASQVSLPIPAYPDDLAADPVSGRVYALYNDNPGDYVLAIDPASGAAERWYTTITLAAAAVDPAAGRLYVLDDRGVVRIINSVDYTNISEVETEPRHLNCQDPPGCLVPDHYVLPTLGLDPGRQRLYVSGSPPRVIDTTALTVSAVLDTPGQLTPDPDGDRLYLTPPCFCRSEQCNTLVLSADTLTGTQALFPPVEPLVSECVFATVLDPANDLLYARIYNGTPGSNSGDYFSVFDVAGRPQRLYNAPDISYGAPALDPLRGRAFFARYRMDRSFIERFETLGQTISRTLQVAGAAGGLAYDPAADRLYAVTYSLQVYDGSLALLADLPLPGQFTPLALDGEAGRLYLGGPDGNLLVLATSGGQLAPPPPARQTAGAAGAEPGSAAGPQPLFVAPTGDRFRIDQGRLYRATPGAQDWQLLGQGLPARSVRALAISPGYATDGTLLAAVSGDDRVGGLYRSVDWGDTWQPATRGLTDLSVVQVVFSPTFSRDKTIFVTTATQGLFRSVDGGDSWTGLAGRYATDQYDLAVSSLALSPTFAADGLVLIAYKGLLRSVDGGDTWQDTGLPPGLVAFSPTFARDRLVLSDGRWRSADGGQTWQPAAAGLAPARAARSLLFSPDFAVDQTVYLLLDRNYDQPYLLHRSTDAGRSWQLLREGLPADFNLASVTVLTGGNLYLGAADGRQVTIPAASLGWGQPPVDLAGLELQDLALTSNGDIFTVNGTAGVFRSADEGRTWQETGFPARVDDSRPARLAAAGDTLFAAAGTALFRSDSSQSWRYLPGLPRGFEVAALAASPNFNQDKLLLAGGVYSSRQLLRSADGGQSWQVVFDASDQDMASDLGLLAFSPNFAADGRVYAWLTGVGLLRSADRGLTWTPVKSEFSAYYAQSLVAGPTGQLYVGALNGSVLVSADEGQTWQDLSQSIPDTRAWTTGLVLGGANDLFIATDKGIYRSLDGGQSWSRASTGLPTTPESGEPYGVRALRFRNGRLYAALTSGGVFISADRAATWQSAGPTAAGPAAPPAVPSPTAPPVTPPPATPVPPPPPACPAPPASFADLWAGRAALLGCPGEARRSVMAEQSFTGGLMFWRSDNSSIYVLPSGQPYARYADTWNETQPAYPCPDTPAQTPPTPQRGFGKVWCNEPGVRAALGNATTVERAFEAQLQEFEHGLIFQTDGGVIYILEDQTNGWERLDP